MKRLRTDNTIKGRITDEERIKECGKEEKFDDSLKEMKRQPIASWHGRCVCDKWEQNVVEIQRKT